MQRREKILIFGFIAVLVLWRGAPAAYRMLYGPIEEREAKLAAAKTKLANRKLEELELDHAVAKTKIWNGMSLPPNPLNAQRLYQEWLTDIGQLSGLKSLKVTPGRRASMGASGALVQVKLEGDCTYSELAAFLDRFRRAPLLHRVVQFTSESPSPQGDPRLKVSFVAEGVSLKEGFERDRLFPETELVADLPNTSTMLEVQETQGLPAKGGFRVRIGDEYLDVNQVARARWTVVRGVDGTKAVPHKSGDRIEVQLAHPEAESLASINRQALAVATPFAKPAPPKVYAPRLAEISRQTINRGTPLKVRVNVIGLEPDRGKPTFSLADGAPADLRLDEKTGEVTWTPEEEVKSGDYTATVFVTLPELDKPLSRAIPITLRDPNSAPKLAEVPPQSVFLGRSLKVKLSATDDGPIEKLTFKLGAGAPAGTAIDEKTGELTWTPSESVEPGDVKIAVTVSDGATPPLTASAMVAVSVLEDLAAYTYFDGVVQRDGRPEAWLRDRLNNRRMVLSQGDRFQVADIRGQIREITRDQLVVEQQDGTWKMRLGDTLRGLQHIAPAIKSTLVTDEPATAEIPPLTSSPQQTMLPLSPQGSDSAATAEIPESR